MKYAALLIMAWGICAVAADQPGWDELASLCGQREDSTNFTTFVKRYDSFGANKGGSGVFIADDGSWSVGFRSHLVHFIHLRVAKETGRDEPRTCYTNRLPFGVSPTTTQAQFISKYGVTNAAPDTWFIGHYRVLASFSSASNTLSDMLIWDAAVKPEWGPKKSNGISNREKP